MASNRLSIALVFVFGCATGGVASTFVVPPVTADVAQRWDYACADTRSQDAAELTTAFRTAGQDGWELVGQVNFYTCLKRPR